MRSIVVFDIDGVIRDVGGSYRRALADTVEQFTGGAYRPTVADIDVLKTEGIWNNDWEASRELVYRHYEALGQDRSQQTVSYDEIVAFFQSRYRGTDPTNWNGYIRDEPLLVRSSYFDSLTEAAIGWGFFSGATRGSATYVLEKRLGLQSPLLVAMEDAPGKPDPTGLFDVVKQFDGTAPVIYAGDTVADMQTVVNARVCSGSASRSIQPDHELAERYRSWIGVGILPPHAQNSADYATAYTKTLIEAGAAIVLENIEQLTPSQIEALS